MGRKISAKFLFIIVLVLVIPLRYLSLSLPPPSPWVACTPKGAKKGGNTKRRRRMRDQRRIPGEIRDIDEILKDFFSNSFLFLRCYFLFSFSLWVSFISARSWGDFSRFYCNFYWLIEGIYIIFHVIKIVGVSALIF